MAKETTKAPAKTAGESICALIPTIMAEVGAIDKGRTANAGGKFKYRGIDDFYYAFQPLLAKHGVFVVPTGISDEIREERQTQRGGMMFVVSFVVTFRAYAADGSYIEGQTKGESMDTSDKASGKAMSYAMKYFLMQLFSVPTDEPENDTESANHEAAAPAQQQRPSNVQPQQQQPQQPPPLKTPEAPPMDPRNVTKVWAAKAMEGRKMSRPDMVYLMTTWLATKALAAFEAASADDRFKLYKDIVGGVYDNYIGAAPAPADTSPVSPKDVNQSLINTE